MKIKHLLLGTILATVAGLAVSAGFAWHNHNMEETEQALAEQSCDMPKSAAAWKEVYSTADELVKGADVVVLAEAVYTVPSRVAYSDGGRDELPFELTAFRTSAPSKGSKADDLIFVERAGGFDSKGRQTILNFDGGDFKPGQSYLLFLKKQEDGPYYYQVNDQGRYEVVDDKLIPVGDVASDKVKRAFGQRTVRESLLMVGGNVLPTK